MLQKVSLCIIDPLVDLGGLEVRGAGELALTDISDVASDSCTLVEELTFSSLKSGSLACERLGSPFLGFLLFGTVKYLLVTNTSEIGSDACDINPSISDAPVVDLEKFVAILLLCWSLLGGLSLLTYLATDLASSLGSSLLELLGILLLLFFADSAGLVTLSEGLDLLTSSSGKFLGLGAVGTIGLALATCDLLGIELVGDG